MSKQRDRKQAALVQLNMKLEDMRPLTDTQAKVFESKNNLVLDGAAGTGKTFVSSYLAYKAMEAKKFDRLIYIRSAVPTRNIGFLPGDEKEKTKVYESPYVDIASELFDRADAYEILKKKGTVEFMTTSHIRGMTIRDSVIIVDECQNMSYHELDSIITRVGEGCRIFFCGDFYQADLKDNGIKEFYSVLRSMEEFDFVHFTIDDIVRSGLVKSYLEAKYRQRPNESDTK